jgi:hypothetical protein
VPKIVDTETGHCDVVALCGKAKAIPVTGLQGCQMLRIPQWLDIRLIDGGKVVIPIHQPRSNPQKHYLMFPVLVSVRG